MARGARWHAVPIAIAIALMMAGPASAAPRAGDRYDGRSATGQSLFLSVAGGGSRLADYDIVVRTRCSDGRRRLQGLNAGGEPAVPIDPAGAFTSTAKPGRLTYANAGRPVTGTATLTFSGVFAASGRSATGTASATFTSKEFRCTARSVSFRVDVDGSRRAPFRNGAAATGRYSVSGRGARFTTFRAFLPSGFVGPLRVRFRADCGTFTLSGTRTFAGFALRGSSFAGTGSTNGSAGGRLRIRDRSFIRGRLFRTRGGSYRVRGSFRLTGRVLRSGRTIDTCRTGSVAFSGRFLSGPKNQLLDG